MDKPYRRYELLLPLRFNDGTAVPEELIGETLLKLRQKFGAVSCESQTIPGQWTFESQVFRDELVRAFVDVPDTPEAREFFGQLKAELRTRFQQLDVWVTTYPLEIL